MRLAWLMVLALALASYAPRSTAAGIVGCNNDCIAQIFVNGELADSEQFEVNMTTGAITMEAQLGVYTTDYSAWVSSFGGNQDPQILFGLGSVNNSLNPVAFSFAFSLPISLQEQIVAYAEVGYTLTDGLGDGVSLIPTSGTGFVVDSQDIRTTAPILNVDKRVDVGPTCSLPGSGFCGVGLLPYSAGPIVWGVPGGPTYNVMTVNVSYLLTARDSAGLSGQVRQDPIPEPGTLGMLGLGLAGLAATRRLRRS